MTSVACGFNANTQETRTVFRGLQKWVQTGRLTWLLWNELIGTILSCRTALHGMRLEILRKQQRKTNQFFSLTQFKADCLLEFEDFNLTGRPSNLFPHQPLKSGLALNWIADVDSEEDLIEQQDQLHHVRQGILLHKYQVFYELRHMAIHYLLKKPPRHNEDR